MNCPLPQVGSNAAGQPLHPSLILHPVHNCGGLDQFSPKRVSPLVPEVASVDVKEPHCSLAIAQQALSIVHDGDQHVDALESLKASLGHTPRACEGSRRTSPETDATYFFVRSGQPQSQPLLAIPLFLCGLRYRLPPPGIVFHELDSATWPLMAVGLPVERLAMVGPHSERAATVDGRQIPLAPDGSAFVFFVPCDTTSFFSFLSVLSAMGAVRQDTGQMCEVTEDVLGTGGCGVVKLANKINSEDEFYALKIQHESSTFEDRKSFVMELALTIGAGRHPNLIRCHGLFLDGPEQQLSILMDCHALGDLKDYVNTYGTFEVSESFVKFKGLLSALVHIHAVGIVHRDIKPENLLISAVGDLVLTDFGVACFADDSEAMEMRCGSPGHVAPEILDGLPYDCKVDVFGAGVVLYYLLTEILPFRGKSASSMLKKNARAEVHLDHPVLQGLSEHGQNFLLVLLQRSPDERPDSQSALRLIKCVRQAGFLQHDAPERAIWIIQEEPQAMPEGADPSSGLPGDRQVHHASPDNAPHAHEQMVASDDSVAAHMPAFPSDEVTAGIRPQGPPAIQGSLVGWSRQFRSASSTTASSTHDTSPGATSVRQRNRDHRRSSPGSKGSVNRSQQK